MKGRTTRRGTRPLSATGLLAAVLLLLSCPNPLYQAVLDVTDKAFNPVIALWQGTAEILPGGSVDFGQLDVAASKEVVFTIRNLGKVQLDISNCNLSGTGAGIFSVLEPLAGLALGGEMESTFTLRCVPVSAGSFSVEVVISSNDPDDADLSFTATVVAFVPNGPEINLKKPDGSALPDGSGSYDYGPVLLGSTADAVFTIENLGTEDLFLNGTPKVLIDGTDVGHFSVTAQPSSLISPSSTTTCTIRFAPTTTGLKSVTVIISNDDANEAPYNITLTGEGGAVPEMNVKQNTTNISDDTGSYVFTNTLVGSTRDVVFTIENLGLANLALTGTPMVAIGGTNANQFGVQADPSTPVTPSGSTTFTIRFAPTSAGAKSATLSIANDDSNENPYNFAISGSGITPEINVKQGTTNIADGTGSYTFANTMLLGSTDVIFTIENQGTASLNLTGTPKVVIGGTNASMFTVTATPSTPVAALGNTSFTIRFSPTGSVGAKSATVSIDNDDLNENPYNFAISGTATEWHGSQTVDSPGDVRYTSIAVSGSTVYIAYYDLANGDLKFAKSIDGGATWPSGSITTVDAAGGSYASIATYNTNVYIAYYNGTDLKFTKSTDGGTTWPAGNIKVVDSTNTVGGYTSIASNGNIVYIAYCEETNDDLKVAKSTDAGTTWPSGSIKVVDSTGTVGWYTSIAVYTTSVYVSYFDGANFDLKFAKSTDSGATWPAGSIKTIDTAGDVGLRTSIAVSGTGVYVSYYDTSNADLKFARSTDGGATWPSGNIKIVDGSGSIGGFTSLALDGSNVYIAYLDGTNMDLKCAKSTDSGATWPSGNLKIVDSAGDVGKYVSLKVSGSLVYISYNDYTNFSLKFAKSADGGVTW